MAVKSAYVVPGIKNPDTFTVCGNSERVARYIDYLASLALASDDTRQAFGFLIYLASFKDLGTITFGRDEEQLAFLREITEPTQAEILQRERIHTLIKAAAIGQLGVSSLLDEVYMIDEGSISGTEGATYLTAEGYYAEQNSFEIANRPQLQTRSEALKSRVDHPDGKLFQAMSQLGATHMAYQYELTRDAFGKPIILSDRTQHAIGTITTDGTFIQVATVFSEHKAVKD